MRSRPARRSRIQEEKTKVYISPASWYSIDMNDARQQPEHVFLVTDMMPSGYGVIGVARTLTGGKAVADTRLRDFTHGAVSEWRMNAIGLWGECSWTRDVEWYDGSAGWQQVSIEYLHQEES